MPKPELVLDPMSSIREPMVSWDSTSTVSKWKLGAQSWLMPEESQGLILEASQLEEYLEVVTKTMRETCSHAERVVLINCVVSGAFRLSHHQRVMREVLERIDAHMTTLEREMVQDKQNLVLRRADLESRQIEHKEQHEHKVQELLHKNVKELEESKHRFEKLLEEEREQAVRLGSESAVLQQRQASLQQQVAAQHEQETTLMVEALARLEEAQRQVAAAANERDEQREMLAILREQHTATMEHADQAYAEIREKWTIFDASRRQHEAAVAESNVLLSELRTRQKDLRRLVDDGSTYVEQLDNSNNDLEAEFVRSMRRSPSGPEWYPVALDITVLAPKTSPLSSSESLQAKLITDIARILHVCVHPSPPPTPPPPSCACTSTRTPASAYAHTPAQLRTYARSPPLYFLLTGGKVKIASAQKNFHQRLA